MSKSDADNDAHSLRVRVSQLESAAEEHKRMIYHLESVLQQEKSETNNLLHLVRTKNVEIDDLKVLLVSKDEERAALFDQVQRYLSSTNMPEKEAPKEESKYVSRWVQTLVEITPPEEVEEMKEEIEYLRQQLEESELDLAQTRRIQGDSTFEYDESASEEECVDAGDSFFRKPPAPTGLSLNLTNINMPKPTDSKEDDEDSDEVATSRVDCTPRVTSKLVLVSPRATETGTTTTVTNTTNQGNLTHRGSRVVATPRISTARMFRSTYIDPTTAASRRNQSIVGDSTSNHASPIRTAPISASPRVRHADITASAPRRVTDDELKNAEQTEVNGYSISMLKGTRAYSVATESNIDGLDMTVGSLNQTHMFALDDSPDCPVCALMEKIQKMYLGKAMRREAYYAVGWIPDMCQSWALDHQRVWTLEERTMLATALADRPKLSTLRNRACEGYVYLWRKRRFWKKPWRPVYAVVQGVFLYIFNTNVPHEELIAIIPIRASYIEKVQLSGREYCLQISSLGCKHCVAGKDGDCVEAMTISVDTPEQLGHWVVALQTKQSSCAHKCSSRFLNQVEGFRDVAEMLIELASKNNRKDLVDRNRFRAKSIQNISGTGSPEASPPMDSLREGSKGTVAGEGSPMHSINMRANEDDAPDHVCGTPAPKK